MPAALEACPPPFPLKLRGFIKSQSHTSLLPSLSDHSPLPCPSSQPLAFPSPHCPLAPWVQSPTFLPSGWEPPRAWSLGIGPEQSLPDSPSPLSLVSLLRAPTAAARGTPLSTTCARAPCCAGHVGSLPTRHLPAAQEPRWADPSPLALLPPVSQSLAATAVWGAVGVASGTTWSPAPTSWATPALEPR